MPPHEGARLFVGLGLSRAVVSCHPLPLVSCNDHRLGLCNNANKNTVGSACNVFPLPRLNSHSRALYSHPYPILIPWLILFPFPWESHGTHGSQARLDGWTAIKPSRETGERKTVVNCSSDLSHTVCAFKFYRDP